MLTKKAAKTWNGNPSLKQALLSPKESTNASH